MTSSERTTNAHNRFSATLLAGSYCCLLEAIDIFTQDLVNKVTTGLLNPSPRETVLIGFYYRSLGYCRTAIELKSVVHQQSLTSAERSVVELYVDMELIHRNVVADGVEKAIAFADVQKLKAAHRMDDFFAGNPGLDSNPSKAATHRDFISKNQARIEIHSWSVLGAEPGPMPVVPTKVVRLGAPTNTLEKRMSSILEKCSPMKVSRTRYVESAYASS